MKFDYTLYLVTNREVMSTTTLSEAVELAILGGCTIVQLREKNILSLDFYKQAMAIKEVTDKYSVPLIINDRIDIALAVNAAGVHIGQNDLPTAIARRVIGDNMLLGVSVSSEKEAQNAMKDGADYLGVGAMFPTTTKADANLVTMEELRKIRRAVNLPIVVIGGINKDNASLFRFMGIDGLAVVSAVIAQRDIKKAAAEMKELFTKVQYQHPCRIKRYESIKYFEDMAVDVMEQQTNVRLVCDKAESRWALAYRLIIYLGRQGSAAPQMNTRLFCNALFLCLIDTTFREVIGV